MTNLPKYLKKGEEARLFPVLADTSKEGRSTSILLSCLSHVHEFGQSMLRSVGQPVGKRANIITYTEVTFANQNDEKEYRPDGLIVLRVGKREWKALVETKVGNNKLNEEQFLTYIKLARKNGIDAVITISNQFTSKPDYHPIKLSDKRLLSKVEIYHWSWMYIFTQVHLLVSNADIEDEDQHFILNEMLRFLEDSGTKVKKEFDSMTSAWPTVIEKVASHSPLQKKDSDVCEIVSAWHQEVQDIDLILSREINIKVKTKLPRTHASDPIARINGDISNLVNKHLLTAKLEVPNAAAPIEIRVDIKGKTICASMMLFAPDNNKIKTNKARLNWLLRQLRKSSETDDTSIGFYWAGGKPKTHYMLRELEENSNIAWKDSSNIQIVRFEICVIQYATNRFKKPKVFVQDLEQLVLNFYKNVGQYLSAYRPPTPRIPENRSNPESVTPEGVQRIAKEEISE